MSLADPTRGIWLLTVARQRQIEMSPVPARRLLTHRFVVWFTASKFFMDSIWYFITF
jgi:hypothetical protein